MLDCCRVVVAQWSECRQLRSEALFSFPMQWLYQGSQFVSTLILPPVAYQQLAIKESCMYMYTVLSCKFQLCTRPRSRTCTPSQARLWSLYYPYVSSTVVMHKDGCTATFFPHLLYSTKFHSAALISVNFQPPL